MLRLEIGEAWGLLGVNAKLKYSFAKVTKQRASCKELLPAKSCLQNLSSQICLVSSNQPHSHCHLSPLQSFTSTSFKHISTPSTHRVWCGQWFPFTIPVRACFRLVYVRGEVGYSSAYILSIMSDKFQGLLPPKAIKK